MEEEPNSWTRSIAGTETSLPVSTLVEVQLLTDGSSSTTSDYDSFRSLVGDWGSVLATLAIEDGLVVGITQEYTP